MRPRLRTRGRARAADGDSGPRQGDPEGQLRFGSVGSDERSASAALSLESGDNALAVEVTAEDGTTT